MSVPDDTHPAFLPVEALLNECEVRRLRRSGPGGQHRNKVETAIVLTHTPTGISAEANERRSQEANRQQAIFRLRVQLALDVRRECQPDSPTELWQSRCRGGKVSIREDHDDFPALLAEVMNQLHRLGYDLRETATFFSCSASQLAKFLKIEPRAFAKLNRERERLGLHPLK